MLSKQTIGPGALWQTTLTAVINRDGSSSSFSLCRVFWRAETGEGSLGSFLSQRVPLQRRFFHARKWFVSVSAGSQIVVSTTRVDVPAFEEEKRNDLLRLYGQVNRRLAHIAPAVPKDSASGVLIITTRYFKIKSDRKISKARNIQIFEVGSFDAVMWLITAANGSLQYFASMQVNVFSY